MDTVKQMVCHKHQAINYQRYTKLELSDTVHFLDGTASNSWTLPFPTTRTKLGHGQTFTMYFRP